MLVANQAQFRMLQSGHARVQCFDGLKNLLVTVKYHPEPTQVISTKILEPFIAAKELNL